ncbi:MAG: hypothetical protein AAF363_00430 [Bacteroidota bacterium]
MRLFRQVICVILFFSAITSKGQSSGQSPFSLQGIGEIYSGDLIHNQLVGGLGVAYTSPWTINYKNPAALIKNGFTGFAMGISGDYRTISTEDQTDENAGGNLDYLALAIPAITGKWTLGLALLPYSQVNYSLSTSSQLGVDSTSVRQTFSGDGGLNQANISSGVRITKNLSLGFSASYIFGPIERESEVAVFDADFGSIIFDRVTYSDVIFGLGALYTLQVDDRSSYTFGIDYDFSSNISGDRTRQAIEGISNPTGLFPIDTVIIAESISGDVNLPARIAIGATYERTNRWKAGVEFTSQAWDEFINFEAESNVLNNSYRIALGGEFIPNFLAAKGYFNRVTYRAGFNYSQTPFLLNGNDVNEIGINFGLSLPVGRISSLDVGAQYSRRGDISDNLIEEQFYKFYLGISFNDIQWKKRPRFN